MPQALKKSEPINTLGITPAQLEDFQRDGYLILRGGLTNTPAFKGLTDELEQYCQTFSPDFRLSNPQSVLNLPVEKRRTLYRGLRYLPALYRFASDPEGTVAISRALGLEFPGIELFNNIRMDLPNEDQFLFQWHQDTSYNLGSVNALTYWVSLSKTNAQYGGIEIIPGSHRRGLWPCEVRNPNKKSGLLTTSDIVITEEPAKPAITLETEPGDAVVFSQLLLHKSLPNRSNQIRWTIQIRHCDFMEPYFRKAEFPQGDIMSLDRTEYLHQWTKDHGTEDF